MKLYSVTSSNIAKIGYDGNTSILEVHFNNGGVYRYYGVTVDVVLDFLMASSKGQFLNASIIGAYNFEKVS